MFFIAIIGVSTFFVFGGTDAIQGYSHLNKKDGFHVFITEEPIGKFCPTKETFNEASNKTTVSCQEDPALVHLIVNWEFVARSPVSYPGSSWDWVGLFEGFPDSHTRQASSPEPIDWKWTGGRAFGSTKLSSSDLFGEQIQVNISSAALSRAKKTPGNCLPYYAVYNRWNSSKQRYEVASIRCHGIYPDWMARSWTSLESFSLAEILIPGTHDAGSATMIDPLASPFTRTQSLGFYRQMLYGVRYFDIRVALNPDLPQKYRIVHNIFWADTSITSLLEDVVRFSAEFPREFIILDFHNFQMGMTNRESYRDLLALIDIKLGNLWIPYEERKQTLGVLEAENKRVAVAWNCPVPSVCAPNSFHPRPWDGIPHVWPNTRSLLKMKHVIRDEVLQLHDGLWVSQPIFTPVKIVTRIPALFQDYEWLNMNVVAVDFYPSNLITDLAIEINFFRWKLLLGAPS